MSFGRKSIKVCVFFVCKRHKKGDLLSAEETECISSGIQREGKEGYPEVMTMSHSDGAISQTFVFIRLVVYA